MSRLVLVFSRAPGREARSKGFSSSGAGVFAAFVAGWQVAARSTGARFFVATPPEDVAGWRESAPRLEDVRWITQRGDTFGQRLEDAVRGVSGHEEQVVVVGGDVPPSAESLAEAFVALESGSEAVLIPAPDGGVSLLSLSWRDLDLLGGIRLRQGDVFASLRAALDARGRRVTVLPEAPDLDSRRVLRKLIRDRGLAMRIPLSVARQGLAPCAIFRRIDAPLRAGPARATRVPRAPPAA